MKIISALKDKTSWWIRTDDGMMRRVRHSLDSASGSPISSDEDLMCALLEKLYPPATTGD